jgi:thymidylate synthase (FAD)
LDPSAQQEIREYANAIAEIVKEKVPIAWQAFLDYEINSIRFTGPELQHLQGVKGGIMFDLTNRELKELDEKLKKLDAMGLWLGGKRC